MLKESGFKLLLSIVVPVYNSEETIYHCLLSLLKQPFSNYEIIAVDDGSTDASYSILQQIASEYSHVHVYRKGNGGQGDARNYGINLATGQYVAFVDSDDTVSTDYFVNLSKCLAETPDLVVMAYKRVYNYQPGFLERIYPFSRPYPEGKNFTIFDAPAILCQTEGSACIKVIRRELLMKDHSLRFSGIRLAEDQEFGLKLFPACQSVVFCHKPLYNYHIRKGSSNFDAENINHFIHLVDSVCTYYKEKKLFGRFKDELEIVFIKQLLVSNLRRLMKSTHESKYQQFKVVLNKLKTEFPQFVSNPYLKAEPFYLRWAVWLCRRVPGVYKVVFKLQF